MAQTALQKLTENKEAVQARIKAFVNEGKLNLPANYSYGNALAQFQLIVQDDKKLMECSPASLSKCMLDMCILGLNPSKKQCYAINYDGKATLMPSYEGNKAMAKRIDTTIADITARTIHAGEEFDFEDLPNGYSLITKHKRSLTSLAVTDPLTQIVGAYATITYKDGKAPISLIMPFTEILKRWKMSKAKPFNADGTLNQGSAHFKFPDKMCERTVINAICQPIIRASDDNDLFCITAQTNYIEAQKVEADMEADENMCSGETIDINFEDEELDSAVDIQTGEIIDVEPEEINE